MSTRKYALFVVISVAVLSLSQSLVIRARSSSLKALFVRFHTVAIFEILISVLSINAWRTLRPLPLVVSTAPPLPVISSRGKSSLKRQKSSETDLSHQDHNESLFKSITDEEAQRGWNLWDSAVGLYIILCHGSYLTNFFLVGTEPHWLSLLCYACLGSLIQLSFALAVIQCMSFMFSMCCRCIWGKYPRKPTIDDVKSQRKSLLALIYVIVVCVIGLYRASQPPSVKRIEVPIQDLPNNLKGLHVIQLSDIHLGPTVGISQLRTIVDIVAKEKPDLLVITGDLVDGTVERLKDSVMPLKSVNPKFGKFYITGNHEYFLGQVDSWFALLRSLNFTILHNTHVKIPPKVSPDHGQICLAGVDDLQADKIGYGMGHTFDVKRAVDGCDSSKPVILLAHQPEAGKIALDSDVRLDLILSGHTHGGQLFPFNILVHLTSPFTAGLYKMDGRNTHLYVSSGTQYWGIPMRLGTIMEITSIHLL